MGASKSKAMLRQELDNKINSAIALAGDNRLGKLTVANAELVDLLALDLWDNLSPAKRREHFGTLNEVSCFIQAVKKSLQEKQ